MLVAARPDENINGVHAQLCCMFGFLPNADNEKKLKLLTAMFKSHYFWKETLLLSFLNAFVGTLKTSKHVPSFSFILMTRHDNLNVSVALHASTFDLELNFSFRNAASPNSG